MSPFVSVVTPFFNTEKYLAECIESVLGQTLGEFEYLLVNNLSTDGSRAIAESYAARDPRIRLIDNDLHVGQVENYNGALARIDPRSRWVKLAQADDALVPNCLAAMTAVGERTPTVGLVSSYYLLGTTYVDAAGVVPRATEVVDGREACRKMLQWRRSVVGSPNTVLYRADLVRARPQFYFTNHLFEDTEAAFEILLHHGLGFVHQVLSFTRVENESIMDQVRGFNPMQLHFYLLLERYGGQLFDAAELERLKSRARSDYHAYLADRSLRLPGERFWKFHRAGLAELGQKLRWTDLAPHVLLELARIVFNPEMTLERAWRAWRAWRRSRQTQPAMSDGGPNS
jgi:glycosyltransferase involved in cell wall biosynthesis